MVGRQTKKRKLYPAIAIVGEGITESIYFTQLRQQEDIQFTVKPDYGKNSSMESIIEKALDFLQKEFDVVFCVIDMDEMNHNPTLKIKYEKLKKKAPK
ncbi:MAG: RloB domain-containing protein [Bacteroidota bacterium]